MLIHLYKCLSERNKINKTLEDEFILDGTMKNDLDIENPTLLFNREILNKYNYAYIPDTGRYYFMTVDIVNKNLTMATLSVDVLMSFKNYILNREAVIERAEQTGNLYLGDQMWVTQQNNNCIIKKFENKLTPGACYILVTAGSEDAILH